MSDILVLRGRLLRRSPPAEEQDLETDRWVHPLPNTIFSADYTQDYNPQNSGLQLPEEQILETNRWPYPPENDTFDADYLEQYEPQPTTLHDTVSGNVNNQNESEWYDETYFDEQNYVTRSTSGGILVDGSTTTTSGCRPNDPVSSDTIDRDTYMQNRVWCSQEPEREYQVDEPRPHRRDMAVWITDPEDPLLFRHDTAYENIQPESLTPPSYLTGGVDGVNFEQNGEHAEVHVSSYSQSSHPSHISERSKSRYVCADKSSSVNLTNPHEALIRSIMKKQSDTTCKEAFVLYKDENANESNSTTGSSAKRLVRGTSSRMTVTDSSSKLGVAVDDKHDPATVCMCEPSEAVATAPSTQTPECQNKGEDISYERKRAQVRDRILKLLTSKTEMEVNDSPTEIRFSTQVGNVGFARGVKESTSYINARKEETVEARFDFPNGSGQAANVLFKGKLYFAADEECASSNGEKLTGLNRRHYCGDEKVPAPHFVVERLSADRKNTSRNTKTKKTHRHVGGRNISYAEGLDTSSHDQLTGFETRGHQTQLHHHGKKAATGNLQQNGSCLTKEEYKEKSEGANSCYNDLKDIRYEYKPRTTGSKGEHCSYGNKAPCPADIRPRQVKVHENPMFPKNYEDVFEAWSHVPSVCGHNFNKKAQLTYNRKNIMNYLSERQSPTAVRDKEIGNLGGDTLPFGNDPLQCGVPDCDCRRKYVARSQVSKVGLPPLSQESSQRPSVPRQATGSVRGSTPDWRCYGNPMAGGVRPKCKSRSADETSLCSSIRSKFDNESHMPRWECVCNQFPAEESVSGRKHSSVVRHKSQPKASVCELGRFHKSTNERKKINNNSTGRNPRLRQKAEEFVRIIPLQDHSWLEIEGPWNPWYFLGCECERELNTRTASAQSAGKVITSTKSGDPKRPCHIPGCECKKSRNVTTKMPIAFNDNYLEHTRASPRCYCKDGKTFKKTHPCTRSANRRMTDVKVTKVRWLQGDQRLKQQGNAKKRSSTLKGATSKLSNASRSRRIGRAEFPCAVQRQMNCVRSSTRKK